MLEPMSDDLAELQREITALLDQLDRLYEEAAAAIDAIADPAEAFRRATSFGDQFQQTHNRIVGRLSKIRARQATLIRDRESLSLAGLAERVSISKARADQLIRAAAEKEQQA